MKLKAGDKVKLKPRHGLSGYQFYRRIKKFKTLTIRRVKPSGGILFNELTIGYNMFGEEQGILPERLLKVKSRKQRKK